MPRWLCPCTPDGQIAHRAHHKIQPLETQLVAFLERPASLSWREWRKHEHPPLCAPIEITTARLVVSSHPLGEQLYNAAATFRHSLLDSLLAGGHPCAHDNSPSLRFRDDLGGKVIDEIRRRLRRDLQGDQERCVKKKRVAEGRPFDVGRGDSKRTTARYLVVVRLLSPPHLVVVRLLSSPVKCPLDSIRQFRDPRIRDPRARTSPPGNTVRQSLARPPTSHPRDQVASGESP